MAYNCILFVWQGTGNLQVSFEWGSLERLQIEGNCSLHEAQLVYSYGCKSKQQPMVLSFQHHTFSKMSEVILPKAALGLLMLSVVRIILKLWMVSLALIVAAVPPMPFTAVWFFSKKSPHRNAKGYGPICCSLSKSYLCSRTQIDLLCLENSLLVI